MNKPFLLLILCMTLLANAVHANEDDILGVWRNPSGKGYVQIYKENGKYYGKVIWLKKSHDDEGKPYLDKKNPDKQFCTKPLLGLIMLRDFLFDDGEWTGGKVYNPDDGKEYSSYMKLKDAKTLFIRGFIGFSWIGKTLTFQRVS
ncbi:MAG: DUF2147 domain-containing protein [Chitinophagaceae bacterium]|nr:DUF2147 domain-containing protein [Chitinophagaceae bacterium]